MPLFLIAPTKNKQLQRTHVEYAAVIDDLIVINKNDLENYISGRSITETYKHMTKK